ncbi:MAG: hypothetical protein LBV08_09115, partial [Clostridiales bacterium]|nr:hypothetical protein [Clostridiales bacterium]
MDYLNIANHLLKDLKDEEVNAYPIKRHPLENYDIDIQEMYICLLCILTNINNNVNLNQQNFLKRILIGINNSVGLIEFYKKASALPQDFIPELAKKFTEIDLKYSLITDMLIILGIADSNDEMQVELISEISLVLKFDLQSMGRCTQIAKSILEQDERIILNLAEYPNNLLNNFICYITEYYSGLISFNDTLIYGVTRQGGKLSFSSLLKHDEG